MAEAVDIDLQAASRALRLQRAGLIVDGVPFDLKQYPYLIDLFDAMGEHEHIVIRKGAQMGFTVSLVLAVIDMARFTYPRGILYLMPTRDDVYDFSRSRFDRMLKDNYDAIGKHVRSAGSGTDSMGIKKIGSAFVYFRGAKSRSQLKSIPVDLLVTDERDEMEPGMVDLAEKRLDGSKFRHHITLSTPTIPDYGVDYEYKRSDERTWHIKCRSCGAWTCMEHEFPKSLKRLDDGSVIRACVKCEKEIFVADGQWVAANEGARRRGYYVSQMCSPTISPKTILDEWEDPDVSSGDRLKEFKNSRLGLAHADIEDVMTEKMLRECCGESPMMRAAQGPCFLGADVGKKVHHYFVGQRTSESGFEILSYGQVPDFSDLHDIWTRFNVTVGVLDEMAETRMVKEFVEAHNGAYGCWYSEAQRTDYDWNEREYRVTANRTEILDQSHRMVLHKTVTFPRPGDRWDMFIKQMTNLARITIRDEKTGMPKTKWIIRGGRKDDHLRHAFAYAVLAATIAPLAERARRIITPSEYRSGRPSGSFMGE